MLNLKGSSTVSIMPPSTRSRGYADAITDASRRGRSARRLHAVRLGTHWSTTSAAASSWTHSIIGLEAAGRRLRLHRTSEARRSLLMPGRGSQLCRRQYNDNPLRGLHWAPAAHAVELAPVW